MATMAMENSVARFYEPWGIYNERMVEVVRRLSAEELQLSPAPGGWPVWATVGHTAGARVYWLCGVFGEPGAETTPFPDAVTGVGWEDDLDTPRAASELTGALESSWEIVDGCLQRWTPESLFEQFEAQAGKKTQVHTRQAVLIRLLSHDAYHCGELSQTLGIHDLPQIDLWRPE
ncbi:MAG: DinB family protein [Acidimicrobiia bacterium]